MRGFRRFAAADQAGQTANPNEIGAIALSAGVLGFADHHSTPWGSFPTEPQLLGQMHTRNH
jgi:hypothetical protein